MALPASREPALATGTQDRDGARAVLAPLANRFSKLRKI